MIKITDALRGEHGVLYRLFDHCEAGAPGWDLPLAKAAGAQLAAALATHAHLEDELLFVGLEPHLPREMGPLAVMRAEHEEIEGALAALEGATDAGRARALLARVVGTGREHFAKEEQVLFPLAESRLAAGELIELGRRWAERRGVAV
jgi:iron-sulfur cluster repair protein YtfE (RIC family)